MASSMIIDIQNHVAVDRARMGPLDLTHGSKTTNVGACLHKVEASMASRSSEPGSAGYVYSTFERLA